MGACCCVEPLKSEKLSSSLAPIQNETRPAGKPRVLQRVRKLSRNLNNLSVTTEADSAVHSDPPKSSEDKALIVSVLQKVFLFVDSTPQDLEPFVEAMSLFVLKAWETVIEEGQMPQYFFILSYGRIAISCQGKFLREVFPGEDFSFSSVISDTPRPATASTLEPSGFWALEKRVFDELLRTYKQTESQKLKAVFDNAQMFLGLLPEQKERLCEAIEILRLEESTVVVEQDTEGDSCFIIKVGTVSCSKDGVEIRRLGPGELFGEQALLYGGRRTASVRTITPTVLWKIERDTLTQVLGDRLDQVMYRNSIRIAFDKNPVLSRLSHKHKNKLISNMRINSYQRGEIGISTRPGQVYIVLQGTLQGASESKGSLQTFSIVGDVIEGSTPKKAKNEDYTVTSESAAVTALDIAVIEHRIRSPLTSAIGWSPAVGDLRKVLLFLGVDEAILGTLARAVVVRSFSQDEVIINENDCGDTLYVIASGEVEVTKQGQFVRLLGPCDYFGERAVLHNSRRTATVTSKADTLSGLSKVPWCRLSAKPPSLENDFSPK